MLARHVVSRGEALAERRAAQRPARARGVGDRVGEVRAPAGDALEGERRAGPADVLGEPGLEARLVDSLVGHGRQSYGVGSLITPGCWSTSAACSRPRSGTASRPSAGTRASRRTRCSALFREDPEALAELRELETGRHRRGRVRAPLRRAPRPRRRHRPDRQHVSRHEAAEPMVAAVRAARAGGVQTGLVSNSWSTSHYDRDLLGRAVRRRRDLGRGGPAQAAARDLPAGVASGSASSPGGCVFVDDLRENCAGAEAVGHDRDPPPRRGRHDRRGSRSCSASPVPAA